MTGKSAHLTLHPERCNACGACVAACPSDAIRVGAGYLLVDSHACNYCCACVEACDQKAIERAVVPLRSASAVASVAAADVTKVVVGSRAEAKAVRKAAGQPVRATAPRPAPAAMRPRAAAGAAAPRRAATAPAKPRPDSTSRSAGSAGAAKPASSVWEYVGTAWTFADAFVVLAVLLVTLVGKNAILALPGVSLMPATGRAIARAAVLASYYAIQVGALVLLAGRHGCTFGQAFGFTGLSGEGLAAGKQVDRPSAVVSAALTVALLVGVEVVAVSYGLIALGVGWRQPVTLSADVSTVFGGGGLGLALSIALVAIVAPVAEELAFRGVILPAAGARWGAWPAIFVSAALFAAYHVTLWLFMPMFVLGVATGWLTVSRRSLWPAIALHVMYNSVAVAAAFMVPR